MAQEGVATVRTSFPSPSAQVASECRRLCSVEPLRPTRRTAAAKALLKEPNKGGRGASSGSHACRARAVRSGPESVARRRCNHAGTALSGGRPPRNVGPGRVADPTVARDVQRAAAGLEAATFAGHSLRAGFMTSASRGGVVKPPILGRG